MKVSFSHSWLSYDPLTLRGSKHVETQLSVWRIHPSSTPWLHSFHSSTARANMLKETQGWHNLSLSYWWGSSILMKSLMCCHYGNSQQEASGIFTRNLGGEEKVGILLYFPMTCVVTTRTDVRLFSRWSYSTQTSASFSPSVEIRNAYSTDSPSSLE